MIQDTFNKLAYVDLRPLNKGVDRETPPHLLEVGAFLTLDNVMVRRGGLERRSGYGQWLTGLPSLDSKVYAAPMWYDQLGTPVMMLVTYKHVYRVDDGPSLTLVSSTLHTGTAAVAVSVAAERLYTVTDDLTTDFTDIVNPGDTVWIGGTSTGTPYEIVGVANEVLTVRDHDGTLSTGTGVTFAAVEGFRRVPDWTVLRQFDGSMFFVWTDNSSRPLRRYDGTSVTSINGVAGDGVTVNPLTEIDTVTAFGGRLWMGGMQEGGRDERFRIRWTTVTDQSEFPLVQYLDLPVRRYGVSRLLPLGNLLVAYFRDGVYFGRPTNITNLPYDFTPYDTGNIGLVGPRAITSWLDAHWFVGQDDVYSFSASRALERIGTKIIRETVQNSDIVLEDTIVVPDPINERIVFQFYNVEGRLPVLWAYYYKTQAWASEMFNGKGVFYGRTVDALAWNEVAGGVDWTDVRWLKAWYTFRPTISAETLYRSQDGQVQVYLDGSSVDVTTTTTSSPVTVIMESGDFDFGRPNVVKSITQLSAKLERPVTRLLEFQVDGRNSRGDEWKSLGTLRVRPGQDEGKVDFRMTGSLFRFRLRSSSDVAPWIMNEIILTASEVGRESVFQ